MEMSIDYHSHLCIYHLNQYVHSIFILVPFDFVPGARNTRRQSARIFEQFTNFEKPKCFYFRPFWPCTMGQKYRQPISWPTLRNQYVHKVFIFLFLLTFTTSSAGGWWIKAWVLPTRSSPNLTYNVVKKYLTRFKTISKQAFKKSVKGYNRMKI